MIVKDQSGREIEISVSGRYDDDIQIEEASYVDSDEEVSEETIEFIQDKFADKIYEEWYENKACESEYFFEGDR